MGFCPSVPFCCWIDERGRRFYFWPSVHFLLLDQQLLGIGPEKIKAQIPPMPAQLAKKGPGPHNDRPNFHGSVTPFGKPKGLWFGSQQKAIMNLDEERTRSIKTCI
jgi:hypothetical protein